MVCNIVSIKLSVSGIVSLLSYRACLYLSIILENMGQPNNWSAIRLV